MAQRRRRGRSNELVIPPRIIDEDSKKEEKPKPGRNRGKPPRASFISQCWKFFRYVLLFLIVPPFINYASLHKEASVLQQNGTMYDIGFGQKMFLACQGKGKPTILLDAPTGMSSDVWMLVQEELAKETKVCAYDRAGIGFSERAYKNYTGQSNGGNAATNPRDRWVEYTVERMADDLHQLVTFSSHQDKPFILVGSELGALVARFYTQLYEADVSELVLVDPLVEDLFTHDSGVWSQFWFQHLIPSLQTMQFSAALGLTRIALLLGLLEQPLAGTRVPEEVISRQKHFMCSPRHLSSAVDEHHFINESFDQMATVKKIKPFPSNVSVTVITGNYYDEQLPSMLNKAWAKSQQYLISHLHPGSTHLVVNGADHKVIYKEPNAITDPLRKIIRKHRKQYITKHTEDNDRSRTTRKE